MLINGVCLFGIFAAANGLLAITLSNPVIEVRGNHNNVVIEKAPIVPNPCPNGWDFIDASDSHVRTLSCLKGDWHVIINPDGTFSSAYRNEPGAVWIYDSTQVSLWPR